MNKIYTREISREDYAAFLNEMPPSAFHRLEWLDAVCEAFPIRIIYLGYFEHDKIVGITPLMYRRIGLLNVFGAPLRKCATPPATSFCIPSQRSAEFLPALHTWAKKKRLKFLQASTFAEAIAQCGARRIECFDNLVLDLDKPLQDVWASVSTLPRRCVRKAVRSGVRVRWLHEDSALSSQHKLVAATYGWQGINPNVPDSLYRALAQRKETSGLRILTATHAGKTVASIWIFCDAHTCYYWDAAALPESRKLDANHLLVWCLIRWAHKKGYKALDFVGGSDGGRAGTRSGIARFKKSMGAQSKEHVIVYWFSKPIELLLILYRLACRIRDLTGKAANSILGRNTKSSS